MLLSFKKVALLGGHVARAMAATIELTPARTDFLMTLVEGPLCQREISDVLCCAQAVISRMVRALVRLGLVERFISLRDKRFRIVQLTPRGRAACNEVVDDMYNVYSTRHGAQRTGEDWALDQLVDRLLDKRNVDELFDRRASQTMRVDYLRVMAAMRGSCRAPYRCIEPHLPSRLPGPPPRSDLVADPCLVGPRALANDPAPDWPLVPPKRECPDVLEIRRTRAEYYRRFPEAYLRDRAIAAAFRAGASH